MYYISCNQLIMSELRTALSVRFSDAETFVQGWVLREDCSPSIGTKFQDRKVIGYDEAEFDQKPPWTTFTLGVSPIIHYQLCTTSPKKFDRWNPASNTGPPSVDGIKITNSANTAIFVSLSVDLNSDLIAANAAGLTQNITSGHYL